MPRRTIDCGDDNWDFIYFNGDSTRLDMILRVIDERVKFKI